LLKGVLKDEFPGLEIEKDDQLEVTIKRKTHKFRPQADLKFGGALSAYGQIKLKEGLPYQMIFHLY
jgi:hypothetical protein